MLIRSTLQYAPSVVLPRLSSFVLLVYLAHRLTPVELGLYALVIAMGEMIDMGFSGWIRFALLRLDIAQPQSWRKALAISYVLYAGSTALALLASLGISALVALARRPEFSLALGAYVLTTALQRIGLSSLQMQQRLVVFSVVESARAVLQVVLVWLTVRSGALNFCEVSLAASAATLVCGLIAVAASLVGLAPDTQQPAAGPWQRLHYGSSLILVSIVTYLATSLDRVLLNDLGGAAALGVYSAAYALGRQPIDVIANSINQGSLPELIKKYDERGPVEAKAFLAHMLELTNLLLLGTFAMLWALARTLAETFLPPAYHAATVVVLPLVALAFIAQNLKSNIFDNVFNLHKNNWVQAGSYVPTLVALFVLAKFLIAPFGAAGAAMMLLAAMIIGLAASLVLTRRRMAVAIDLREFIKAAAMALAGGAAAAGAVMAVGAWPAVMRLLAGAVVGSSVWVVAAALVRPAALEPIRNRFAQGLRRAR